MFKAGDIVEALYPIDTPVTELSSHRMYKGDRGTITKIFNDYWDGHEILVIETRGMKFYVSTENSIDWIKLVERKGA